MSEDARVTMVWPADLKERAREKVGGRGLTAYVIEAVEAHLVGSDAMHQLQRDLDATKHIAQLLADTVVMGGEREDRLQALMEIEFPSWIDTTGWPKPMADRVRPEAYDPMSVDDDDDAADAQAAIQSVLEPVPDLVVPEREPVDPKVTLDVEDPAPVAPAKKLAPENIAPSETVGEIKTDLTGRDDLFARMMTKLGEPEGIVRGSEIEPPAPKEPVAEVELNMCPKCGDELVEGECWSCGWPA